MRKLTRCKHGISEVERCPMCDKDKPLRKLIKVKKLERMV